MNGVKRAQQKTLVKGTRSADQLSLLCLQKPIVAAPFLLLLVDGAGPVYNVWFWMACSLGQARRTWAGI